MKECDPKKAKPCDKSNMRCEDDAGDGHWECSCVAGYTLDSDGLCELGKLNQIVEFRETQDV